MASFLVLYGTSEGQTAKVASRINDSPADRGHDATTVNVESIQSDFTITDFDAVLVGASIHVGKQQPAITEFVRNNHAALASRPTAFFQRSLPSAVADEARQADAARYVDEPFRRPAGIRTESDSSAARFAIRSTGF